MINNNKMAIQPNNGYGGIGGLYCKPIGLANVHQFYTRIGHKIDIIACGGVSSTSDILSFVRLGASAVQIGTHLSKNNPAIFSKFNKELKDINFSMSKYRGKVSKL